MTISQVTRLQEVAQQMVKLSSNEPQRSETGDTRLESPTIPVCNEDFEFSEVIEFSRDEDDFFSFASFDSFENS
jgi:hypothetical protein